MNQAQRKYLIDKIQKNTEETIKQLVGAIPKCPEASNYCVTALAEGSLRLKSPEAILDTLRMRWLANGSLNTESYFSRKSEIKFAFHEIFELPEEYRRDYAEWEKEEQSIKETINTLRVQSEGLCTRIQLASDKTLDKMIAEVDDMGDLSFMDCTLKALMTKSETNLLK